MSGSSTIPVGASDALSSFLAMKTQLGTYRTFIELAAIPDAFPWFRMENGESVLNMSSNDYLGLSQSKAACEAAIRYIEAYGLGSGGSRNIGGTRPEHEALEEELRSLHDAEDCLLYTSGNAANGDIIAIIARYIPNAVFFSDQQNHASLIEPMRGLGSRKIVFDHNSLDDLKSKFFKAVTPGSVPVLVIESLYSMSGDWGEVIELCTWFKGHGGLVIVNEVHAVGVCGPTGAGRLAQLGRSDLADLVIGSLSKAFGAFGGYIAGARLLVDTCRQSGVRSVFTTSIPGAMAIAALENVRHSKHDRRAAVLLAERVLHLRAELERIRVAWSGSDGGHITRIPLGDEGKCQEVHLGLLQRGYYATAIRHPTVPKGDAQLRVIVNPFHTPGQITLFADALAEALTAAGRAPAYLRRRAVQ
jgi:5-aminolevulinate synthase